MKTANLLLPWVAVMALRAFASDYYFDAVDGNDLYDGSATAPWKSIEKANAIELRPGDALYFHAGHAFAGNLLLDENDVGSATEPVRIASYGSGFATIDAGTGTGVLVRNTGGVIVENLRMIGSGMATNIGSGIRFLNTLPDGVKLEFVRIRNVECSGFGSDPKGVRNEWGVLEDYGQGIFVGGRPADRGKSGFRDVLIESSVCFDNAYYGILISGAWNPDAKDYANENVRIIGCQAYGNPGDPRLLATHSGSGILMSDVRGGLIDHCTAWENGALCRSPGGGPCGIWAATATGVIIQRCEAWRNRTACLDGAGFDLDGGVTDSILQYNYSHENDGAGYLLFSYGGSPHRYARNIVRFNVSVDDGRRNDYGGITVGNYGGRWENLDVYQNTVVTSASSAGASCLRILPYSTASNVRIFNNLFVARSGAPVINVAGHPGLVIAGNAYWSIDGEKQFLYEGQTYASLGEWRDAVRQEYWNGQSTGFDGDPLLELPSEPITVGEADKLSALAVYRLLPGSPLYGAALNITEMPTPLNLGERDFFGQPVNDVVLAIGAAQ